MRKCRYSSYCRRIISEVYQECSQDAIAILRNEAANLHWQARTAVGDEPRRACAPDLTSRAAHPHTKKHRGFNNGDRHRVLAMKKLTTQLDVIDNYCKPPGFVNPGEHHGQYLSASWKIKAKMLPANSLSSVSKVRDVDDQNRFRRFKRTFAMAQCQLPVFQHPSSNLPNVITFVS